MTISELGEAMPANGVGRRETLGAAGLAACGLALAGCGGGGATANARPDGKARVIARTAEVPVGGGKLIDDLQIVVTQPAQGVFKAYSSACTHRGCAVGAPVDNVMRCPCHGSEFAADSGKALSGPATAPLVAVQVRVEGDGIVIGNA